MDIKNYLQDKADGLVSLAKTDDGTVVVITKQFDPRSGIQLKSTVVSVDKEELLKRKEELALEMKDLDGFLIEMNSAELI